MTLILESRMQGNLHVRFGGGELEKCQQWQLAGFLSYTVIGETESAFVAFSWVTGA